MPDIEPPVHVANNQAMLKLSKSSIFWISLALCLATLCVAIDNTIISTAVPRITSDFQSLDDVGWYASIYPLMSCIFQPVFGKTYTLLSHKTVFLASLAIFEAGSAVCGAAPNSKVFIFGRALAGLGSAGIQAGTTLIIARHVALRQRPTYNSIVGSMFAIGSVAGPLLGGAFSDSTTWRWCFYINLPVGGAVLLLLAIFYERRSGRDSTQQAGNPWRHILSFDWPGTLVFMSATICILLALSWGGTTYAWGSSPIIALLCVAGVLLVTFVRLECWVRDPIIPLRLLKERSMMAGICFGLCLGGVFFVNVFYIPLWFQLVDGVTAVKSAILFIPFMLSVVGGFMFAGFGTTASGYYTPFVWAGTILMSVGTGLITTVSTTDTTRAMWIGFQILTGAGIGMGEEQGLIMVQCVLPEEDVAVGVGIILFAQTFGGSLFVSVAQAVFLNRISQSLRTLAPDVDPYAVLQGTSTSLPGFSDPQTASQLRKAYGDAIKAGFHVSLVLATVSALGAVLYEWRSIKAIRQDGESEIQGNHVGIVDDKREDASG